MQLSKNAISRSRATVAVRLIAAIFAAVVFSASVFAQVPPTLTLNSNVGLFFFGRFNTGTISPNTVITISNGGTGGVIITNVQITGANPGDFTLVGTTCINATLTSTGTCTATVRFNPIGATFGSRNANLTVTDNANGSQHLVPLRGTALNPAIPNKAVGPVDPRIGYPYWYQDELGVKLYLCLDLSGNCITTPPNAGAASVTTASINFPDEAFYWYADARINRASGGNVRLVLAKEAAFTSALPSVGNQITFERIRVRIDQLTPGATYTITHPFGVMTATADADGGIVINSALKATTTASTASASTTTRATATRDGFTPAAEPTAVEPATVESAPTDTKAEPDTTIAAKGPGSGGGGGGGSTAEINTTEDIGCGSAPCDFRVSLEGKLSRFLRWDPAINPQAPAGYLGNPNVTHAITGSPFNTNIFKVDGPNVGGPGINSIQTNLFTLAGKLFQ
jgi:hypothetical protein